MTDKKTFETLNFDNLVLRTLPIDPIADNYVRPVKDTCFSKIKPTPCSNPSMVLYSKDAMKLIDLDETELKRDEAAEYLSGNKLMPGSETASHCYCGHQFGHFAGQLGDGAAIYLGEVLNNKGNRWEIQIKGAGKTPYSRTADGRKVLRSTLREFLCSEAMHFLNIATTRAGSCIVSDSQVMRDIHYDGNPKMEKCAMVLRIAESFIRFGSFEAFMPSRGIANANIEITKNLLDYVCDTFYVDEVKGVESSTGKYEIFLKEIVQRTAKLVADWQCCGFVHGVLNTDNMSILGLTIDYGPYGFLDRYNPDHIFNGSDTGGRYTYKNQVKICEWNLNKLAEALTEIVPLTKSKAIIAENYKKEYNVAYLDKMNKKLGLMSKKEDDNQLISQFLNTMFETGADFTNSFRKLSHLTLNGRENIKTDIEDFLNIILNECSSIDEFRKSTTPKFKPETLVQLLEVCQQNPAVLEYYGLSEAIVKKEVEKMEKFAEIVKWTSSDKSTEDRKLWAKWLESYLDRIYSECENFNEEKSQQRINLMNSNNPRFILRNHLAQDSIEGAEKKEFTEAKILLKLLENAFSDEPLEKILEEFLPSNEKSIRERSESKYYENPPELNKCISLSCSS